MSNLVTGLMIAHIICSYLIAIKFARLVFADNSRKGYGFKIKWYDKAASSYVLALPIYLILTYLTVKL